MGRRQAWIWGVAACALMGGQAAMAQETAGMAAQSAAPGNAVEPITNLSQALNAAYNSEPNLLSDRAGLRAANERVVQSRALYGPSLGLSANYGYTHDRFDYQAAQPGLFGRAEKITQKGDSGAASLVFNQPLFASGRLSAGVQAANAQVAFQRENLRFTEQRTMLSAINSYVGLRRDRELLDIANGNLALLDRQFSESESRFRVREITRTDLDQVVTRVELGRATVQTARSAVSTSNSQFIQTVGAPAGDLAPLPPLPNLPLTLEEAHAAAETGNPLILAARARERISRARVAQARAELGPDVSLRGEATFSRDHINDDAKNDLYRRVLRGEVTLQMPLYTSGQLNAAVREAKANNDADWRLIDASSREVRVNVDAAWNQLVATRSSIANLENAVAAAQRAYDGAVVQLRTGARTTLDVLDLARDLLDARSQLVSFRASEYLAGANLLVAMGKLEMQDIDPAAKRYDPEEHYRKVLHKGDTPLLSTIPTVLDGLVAGSTTDERPSRDEAAGIQAPALGPLPPPPAQSGP